MRKTALLLLILLFTLASTKLKAQYEGTFGMGAHIDYASEIQRPGIGIDLQYYITNNIRVAPSLTYYMQVKEKRMWNLEGDVHYMIPTSRMFSLYPVVGVAFSEWKNMVKSVDSSGNDIYNNRLGLNAGLGMQYDFRYKTRLNFEVKYQSIKDYSQAAISLGIGFWI